MKRLALLALLGACGMPHHVDYRESDPELIPSIEAFKYEAITRGVKVRPVVATFVDKWTGVKSRIKGLIGVCYYSGRRGAKIEILRSFYDKSSRRYMELLMAHEQGHCALGLGHTNSKRHIMNSYILKEFDWLQNREEYLNMMFDPFTK